MPAKSIAVFRGESIDLDVTVLDANGAAQDLTGTQLVFTLRDNIGDTDLVLQKTSALSAEIEILSAVDGTARIHVLASETEALAEGARVYDLWIVFDATTRQLIAGPAAFTIRRAVTTFPLS